MSIKTKIIIFVTSSILFIGGLMALLFTQKSYLTSNLGAINENTKPINSEEKIQKLFKNNNVVFYKSNCSYCEKYVPAAYIFNKFDSKGTIYLDVNNRNNALVFSDITQYPKLAKYAVSYKNGIYEHKQLPLYDKSSPSKLGFSIVLASFIFGGLVLVITNLISRFKSKRS